MNENNVYVLIHSPLVGGLTWTLVSDQMRQHALNVVVPILVDLPDFRRTPLETARRISFRGTCANSQECTPITLVAHSGAGPLLPCHTAIPRKSVNAYVFVDAGIPRDGSTRLDLMKSEDPEWAEQFQTELERGRVSQTGALEDLRDVIPDESLRKQMVAEIRPRRLSFFMEPIPVFSGWPDAPCAYIRFSAPYEKPAAQARQAGWPTYELEAGHFHMLVDPATVAEMILKAVNKLI